MIIQSRRIWLALTLMLLLISGWAAPVVTRAQATEGVVGRVSTSLDTIDIFRLPDSSMPPHIRLNAGTFITVVGRSESARWLNVRVPGNVGGWLPSEQLTIMADNFDTNTLPLVQVDEDTILQYSLLWNFESSHNQDVFVRGRSSGKQLNGLAKVGDSISASQMYLHPYGNGIYDLQAFPHLQHVLDFFGMTENSSFARNSLAVRNGWSTRDILNERNALQRGCPSGSTPLTCEYDALNPAYALIMLGTNDVVIMNSNEFQANMEEIVNITLSRDIIPILLTMPPHLQPQYDVTPYNRALVRISQKYDIALINYWLSVQPLPNQGISSDLVHPSGPPSNAGTTLFTPEYLQYGYTMRNLVTLQGLDLLLNYTVYPSFD